MLNRFKTAAKGAGNDTSPTDNSGRWNRRGSSSSNLGNGNSNSRAVERDQFRVHQQGFYVRGDVVVDVHQARGIRPGTNGDRTTYCVVLVDGERVGETAICARTQTPVWNQPIKVSHETIRQAADRNVWPVPYQPITVQIWDRGSTSDTLLGSARVAVSKQITNAGDDEDGWRRLVGTGDQGGGDSEPVGKIRVRVHWDSGAFSSSPKDKARFFLRDIFAPEERDYQHLYYGALTSTFLAPPAGEEVLLEMMAAISRHDPTAGGYGKGVEGMLVLTELRLLFLPDMSAGSATASFLEFHTVQVYLAAVRSFSHRGLEGGSRLLSVTSRDGRSVHFRMPAAAATARCGAWYDAECARRRMTRVPMSGGEELWQRGLWGAGTSEQWMERLADEIRWRKAQGDFVSLWYKLVETTASLRTAAIAAATEANGSMHGSIHGPHNPHQSPVGTITGGKGAIGGGMGPGGVGVGNVVGGCGGRVGGSGGLKKGPTRARGDASDGWAAMERDLERVGVQGTTTSSYSAFGRQNWEMKTINKDYSFVPTYPQALAFPSSITPAQLTAAAPQRSRCRLPALVWLHPNSKAPLVRSSQPMAGMTTKVLSEDIHLLKHIRVTVDATKISIVDARSLLNAKANQVTGKGFEDVADIGRDVATLSFMGIENIHAVRDSLSAFSAASMAQGQEYYHAVGASGWLRHLSQIMKGAAFVVDELQKGVAVLVHCSDGWDRTAQLTALAQLYLDPYYRTLDGFEVLVEKEWCSFGHMFGQRAHSDSPTESSPVFLQWLDAVWQLVRQYPGSFEFTGHYLERLVEALYSAAFLNFAGNCESERKEKLRDLKEAGSGGVSVFAYLREHAMEGHMTTPLVNSLYRPRTREPVLAGSGKLPPLRSVDVLRPCCESQGLEIWQAVYMRDNLLLHHREHQLSVEQGLRLQVYDFKRRMDLLEVYADRLPRGLVGQLVSANVGMDGEEWDSHRRLVDQASADQDARAATASAASAASAAPPSQLSSIVARGRSGARVPRRPNEDSSRSRSRSFNVPLRGWVGSKAAAAVIAGERRLRGVSQDSLRDHRMDTDFEDVGEEDGGGMNCRGLAGGSGSIRTGSGSGSMGADDNEAEMERLGRTRSFFLFGGKRGGGGNAGTGRKTRILSAAGSSMNPAPPAVSDSSEGSVHNGDGGGGNRQTALRRRASSKAGIGGGDRSGGGGGGGGSGGGGPRPRMWSSSGRTSVAPFSGPSPPTTGTGTSGAAAVGISAAPPAKPLAPRRRPGRGFMRSNSLDVGTDDSGKKRSMSRHNKQDLLVRPRMASAAAGTGGAQQRGQRAQTIPTPEPQPETPEGDAGGGSSTKANRWMFARRKRSMNGGGSGGGAGGTIEKDGKEMKKGMWGSLQRTLTGRVSRSPKQVSGKNRAQRTQPTPTDGSPLGDGSGKLLVDETPPAGGGSSISRTRAPVPTQRNTNVTLVNMGLSDGSSAQLERRRREQDEAEARRQMLHTIVTLEVQLLIKDIVDEACLQAAERPVSDFSLALSSLKFAPPSASSGEPAVQPPLSTATTSERPAFFGGLLSAGERQQRRHSSAGVVDENGREAAALKAAGSRDLASAESSRVSGGSGGSGDSGSNEEEGFFAALRRKLFDGQDTPSRRSGTSSSTGTAPLVVAAISTAALAPREKGPEYGRAVVTSTAPAVRAMPAGTGSRVYHGNVGGGGAAVHARKVRQSSAAKAPPAPSLAPPPPAAVSSPAGIAAAAAARAAAAASAATDTITTTVIGPAPTAMSAVDTAETPSSDPDAGAGGERPKDRSRMRSADIRASDRSRMRSVDENRRRTTGPTGAPARTELTLAPDRAEEAAAKFGLVRMVFGE